MKNRVRDPLSSNGLNHRLDRAMPGLLVACCLASLAAPAHAQYYASPYAMYGAMSMVPRLGVSLVRTALMPISALTRRSNKPKNNSKTNTSVNGQVAQPNYAPQAQNYPATNGQNGYMMPQTQGYAPQNMQGQYTSGYSNLSAASYVPQTAQAQAGMMQGQIPGMQNQPTYNSATQFPAGSYGSTNLRQ